MTRSAGVLKHKATLTIRPRLRLLFFSSSILASISTSFRHPHLCRFLLRFANMALDLCGHQISVTCTFTSPASEAPPIWRRERGCATHRRNVFHLMFAYGVRQCGEGLACVPNIGATFFRLLFFFFGVSPMRRRTAMVAKYRHHVFPPHLITALSLYCFRGSANMAPDLCGRQTLAACISTSPASEAPPIWRQECGCAIHRRSVFHLAFAYGVRRRGEGLACVPNIGATFFRLLLFLTGFRPYGDGLTWLPNVGVTYFHPTFVFRGLADMAADLRECHILVPRSSTSACSLWGFADMASDLRGFQTLVPRTSTPSFTGLHLYGVGLALAPDIGAIYVHLIEFPNGKFQYGIPPLSVSRPLRHQMTSYQSSRIPSVSRRFCCQLYHMIHLKVLNFSCRISKSAGFVIKVFRIMVPMSSCFGKLSAPDVPRYNVGIILGYVGTSATRFYFYVVIVTASILSLWYLRHSASRRPLNSYEL
jgi:hypothetical protein